MASGSRPPHGFIASSSQAKEIAKGIKANLEKDSCTAEVWDSGFFEMSSTLLQDLATKAVRNYDFAVFVFNTDDEVRIAGKPFMAARDNVVFEFGLFIAAIGISRCFVVIPENRDPKRPLRFPSDLDGLTHGIFRAPAQGETWESATLTVSNTIASRVRKNGKAPDSLPSDAVETALKLWGELDSFACNSADEPDVMLYHLLEKAHYGGKAIADLAWGIHPPTVVSFKLQNTEDSKLLDCHYLPTHNHHAVRGGGYHPKTIPIVGSASGAVFESGVPAVAESVQSRKFYLLGDMVREKKFSRAFHDVISDRVKSLIAWPIKLNGTVVSVVKCDSTVDHFFRREDSRTCAVVGLIAATFQRAFEHWQVSQRPAKRMIKK